MVSSVIISYRLGCADGVSVEAAKWADSLMRLGLSVRTVAGEGSADVVVPGLGLYDGRPLCRRTLSEALVDADIIVVENVLSLPLNRPASTTLATELRGRAAILHHHDLPWQRRGRNTVNSWPPDDSAWRHVTINHLSRSQLAARGIPAVTIYNTLASPLPVGRRHLARSALGVAADARLVLQPTRAIPRKNIPAGLAIAEALAARFWLTGPVEEGYGPALSQLLATAQQPVLRGLPAGLCMADAYAAADVIVLPSIWEGFGNPVIEAAAYQRPLVVGHYPVLDELRRYGFRWFSQERLDELENFLRCPDPALLAANKTIVARHFDAAALDQALADVLNTLGLR